MIKQFVNAMFKSLGYTLIKSSLLEKPPADDYRHLPDGEFYRPKFSPWWGYDGFEESFKRIEGITAIPRDRMWMLLAIAKQLVHTHGNWMEIGVYRGGSAMLLAEILCQRNVDTRLHLFDTFEGMPETNPDIDVHRRGDFNDTSLEEVRDRVLSAHADARDRVTLHKGLVQETFEPSVVGELSMVHIDVDIYESVKVCCELTYPHVLSGGFMVFDDYGIASCPGARRAVDEFFADKPEVPLVMMSGQALVVRQR